MTQQTHQEVAQNLALQFIESAHLRPQILRDSQALDYQARQFFLGLIRRS